MDWTTLLFSFRGRINRGKYWFALVIYTLIWIAFLALTIAMIGANSDSLFSLAGASLLIWATGLVLTIGFVWSSIATGIKRLHDRDRSGWWILLFWLGPNVLGGIQAGSNSPVVAMAMGLGSIAIGIWGFVALGCLRGTPGPNRYGPDPLQFHEAAVTR